MPKKNIYKWIEVPDITPFSEHGVDFLYGAEADTDKNSISLGFIKGYTWLNKKGGEQCIYILSKDSIIWKIISEDPVSMVNELKECIYLVLQGKRGHGQITPSICAWFNA